MKFKILPKKTRLLLVLLLGLTFFIAPVLDIIPKSFAQDGGASLLIENAFGFSSQNQARIGLPMRLKIPSIQIDAAVEHVGLTSGGAMDMSNGPAKVAWFYLGSRPGEKGNAVIAGHYGWRNNIAAVFDNLHTLQKGDTISVEDEKGIIVSFIVSKIQTYQKDEVVSHVFISNDDKAHLNLITCAGTWDTIEKNFSERLVVFTDKESSIEKILPPIYNLNRRYFRKGTMVKNKRIAKS